MEIPWTPPVTSHQPITPCSRPLPWNFAPRTSQDSGLLSMSYSFSLLGPAINLSPSNSSILVCLASMQDRHTNLDSQQNDNGVYVVIKCVSCKGNVNFCKFDHYMNYITVILFFPHCSWGSQGKKAEVVCHSLLQWTAFWQNSPSWSIHLGWPHKARLTISLSQTRLWSMWSVWLVICDCGFHCVCPLMDEDKRLVEASGWEGLVVGKTGSCSGGQVHAQ